MRAARRHRRAGHRDRAPSSWSASPASPPSGSSRALGTDALRDASTLHPLLNPAAYVDAPFADGTLAVSHGPAHDDGAWITLCGPDSVRPLQAAVRAVDPHLDVEVTGSDTDWTATARAPRPSRRRSADEVAVTRFSTGASFAFEPRRSLPITPV